MDMIKDALERLCRYFDHVAIHPPAADACEDLEDEGFEVEVILPGTLRDHTGGRGHDRGAVVWKFGAEDLETLKTQVSERIAAEYDGASRAVMKRALLDELDKAVAFDLPPSLVEAEAGQIAHQLWHDENPDVEGHDHDKIEPTDFGIRLHSEIGKRFPLHCTAMGKVLLAYSDAATIRTITRRKLKRYTANTITDPKALRLELETVVANGYAVDREEITRGLVCIAAPIYGVDGNVEAAISCTMSSFDATEKLLKDVARHVVECAQTASALERPLGYETA